MASGLGVYRMQWNNHQLTHNLSKIEREMHSLATALFAFVQNLRLNNPRFSQTDDETRGFSYYSNNYYYAPVPVDAKNRSIQRTVYSKGRIGR